MKAGLWTVTFYLVLVALIAYATNTRAGEIIEHPTDTTVIAFVGEVTSTDPQMLRDYLVEHQDVTTIALYSGGGQVISGLEMMEIINLRGLKTRIPDGWKCYSICSFMFLGGTERAVEGTGELGVHQVFAPEEVGLEMGAEAYKTMTMQTIAYMMYMLKSLDIEVDSWFWIMMLNTPGDDMYIFTPEQVALFTE